MIKMMENDTERLASNADPTELSQIEYIFPCYCDPTGRELKIHRRRLVSLADTATMTGLEEIRMNRIK